MRPSRKRGQGDTLGHGKQLVDGGLGRSYRATIRARSRDDEQDMLDPRITALEHDPPRLRLEVVDSCLGLRREERGGRRKQAVDHPVPGPLITLDRQGHLGPQLEVGMQAGPQAIE